MKKTLGIIGGMGPAATCDLMEKVIALTRASCDQEHIHIITDCNTNIPDRTAAILQGGPDPVPELQRSAARLETAGAEILCMPCNTAHHFYDTVAAAVQIPGLHMPRETAGILRQAGVKTAGVLATDGTVQSGVYEKALAREGIEAVYPDKEDQAQIMRLIYQGVKARAVPLADIPVGEILSRLRGRGAEVFLLACTELPIAFAELGRMEGCLDPTRVLAFAAVRACGGETTADSPW
ncbi:MAG: amino acid racemase [Oscillospiraceae bacterium]|nr:amino acid racemase [Oscillospiraceae bacterium]